MNTDQVRRHYGDIPAICAALGINRATWYRWQRTGIPYHWQWAIAWMTAGRLRPAR